MVTPIGKSYKSNSIHNKLNAIPLHLCRGHIKRYTPEKPLFGKIVGQFFWHPHMRGKIENGENHNDYILKEK